MARFQGAKEKAHLPIYDAFFVPGARNGASAKKFEDQLTDPRVIRFFVDVQNKTKLETNLQAAGVLPSMNTFEARAMRVVVATPPQPVFNRTDVLTAVTDYCGSVKPPNKVTEALTDKLVHSILKAGGVNTKAILDAVGVYCGLSPSQVDEDRLIGQIEHEFGPIAAKSNPATGEILAQLIYNSVTTLLVGEKIMIEMPTFWFPAGAGVSPGNGTVTNHGEPDPMATFRFAEPVFIEPQQNFRVEMLFPQGVPDAVRSALGPLRIWVVLDGYLTRDVQ